jgi:hypothetical protein
LATARRWATGGAAIGLLGLATSVAAFQRRDNGNRVDDWMTIVAPFGSASMSGTPDDSEISKKNLSIQTDP